MANAVDELGGRVAPEKAAVQITRPGDEKIRVGFVAPSARAVTLRAVERVRDRAVAVRRARGREWDRRIPTRAKVPRLSTAEFPPVGTGTTGARRNSGTQLGDINPHACR